MVLHPILSPKARILSTQCGDITGHHPAQCSAVWKKHYRQRLEEGHTKSKSRRIVWCRWLIRVDCHLPFFEGVATLFFTSSFFKTPKLLWWEVPARPTMILPETQSCVSAQLHLLQRLHMPHCSPCASCKITTVLSEGFHLSSGQGFLEEKKCAKMGFLNFVFSNFSLITKYKILYLTYFKFIVKD